MRKTTLNEIKDHQIHFLDDIALDEEIIRRAKAVLNMRGKGKLKICTTSLRSDRTWFRKHITPQSNGTMLVSDNGIAEFARMVADDSVYWA